MKAKSIAFLPLGRSRASGMALVVTLSLVVLVTVSILTFLSMASKNNLIEVARSDRVEVEQLALSASDYVVSLFLQEIASANNSTSNVTNSIAIYQPKLAANAIPQRTLSSGIKLSDATFSNLTRQSVSGADPNASSDNTSLPSHNGRILGVSRWNAPYLIKGTGFESTQQLPCWVYFTNEGEVVNSNRAKAVGRFAYNVYNVGGLLDVNVAGYPDGMTATQLSQIKGTLAGADLSKIPGIDTKANAGKFIAWRNPATAITAGNYTTGVTNALASGFLSPSTGDRSLTSRMDLIKLARTGVYGVTTSSLPYLTTFSRVRNAPQWQPKLNTSVGGEFNYKNKANDASSSNRNLPNVRVSRGFTRRDGTTAKIGEPLLKYRFPLNKISLLGTGGSTSEILSYFGLKKTSDGWTYDHGDSGHILTLDEISDLREPDFFELLKAVILSGSIGQTPGAFSGNLNYKGVITRGFEGYSSWTDMHILQIGANIIDQYDEDSYPTAIYLNGITDTSAVSKFMKTAYGVENLPYLHRITEIQTIDSASGKAESYFQPILWNPHVQRDSTVGVPGNFRISTYGGMKIGVRIQLADSSTGLQYNSSWVISPATTYLGDPAGQILIGALPANSEYSAPYPVTTTTGILIGRMSTASTVLRDQAISAANDLYKNQVPSIATNFKFAYIWYTTFGSTDLSFVLEYADATGNWKPYAHIARYGIGEAYAYGNILGDVTKAGLTSYGHIDPRTERFSISFNNISGAFSWSIPKDKTSYPALGSKYTTSKGLPIESPTYTGLPGPFNKFVYNKDYTAGIYNEIYYVDIFQNTASGTHYVDADGITRPADGALAAPSSGAGCPTFVGGVTDPRRPIVLNRPFRSVGELGYVFRDLPYSSINFSSTLSGDFGMLDVFSVSAEQEIIGGTINPSVAPQEVLSAILTGAVKQELPMANQSFMTGTEADKVAVGIKSWLSSNKACQDREDLAVAVETAVEGQLGTVDVANKNLREASIRALSSVSDFRTWNLLIDVVAQSGRNLAGSSSGSDFEVRGERRYWLHVAVDRVTGKVIARNLELVNE